MKLHLTESAIKAATKRAAETGKREELADAAQQGLRVRVTSSGGRTWVLGARDAMGRSRRVLLGEFPGMGIAEAREAARAARADLRRGADPIADARHKRAVAKAAREGVGTLAALVELYEKKQGCTQKSWPDCRRRIEGVFKPLLRRPLDTLQARDFQLQADSWPSAQSAAAAVRYVRPMLKWAAASGRGYLPREIADLVPPATTGRRDRVLDEVELSSLLPALRASEGPYGACLKFLLLTLARRSEATSARWKDVDVKARTWTIRETKNGQPHIVPLSAQALALLTALRPVDDAGELAQGAADRLIFSTAAGGTLDNFDRATKQIMKASGTDGWTRHDLRRTGATLLGEMGEMPDIIEAALNHVSIRSRLAATYNRSRYRPQVAAALQRLADRLDGIEAGAAVVVPLRQA